MCGDCEVLLHSPEYPSLIRSVLLAYQPLTCQFISQPLPQHVQTGHRMLLLWGRLCHREIISIQMWKLL